MSCLGRSVKRRGGRPGPACVCGRLQRRWAVRVVTFGRRECGARGDNSLGISAGRSGGTGAFCHEADRVSGDGGRVEARARMAVWWTFAAPELRWPTGRGGASRRMPMGRAGAGQPRTAIPLGGSVGYASGLRTVALRAAGVAGGRGATAHADRPRAQIAYIRGAGCGLHGPRGRLKPAATQAEACSTLGRTGEDAHPTFSARVGR